MCLVFVEITCLSHPLRSARSSLPRSPLPSLLLSHRLRLKVMQSKSLLLSPLSSLLPSLLLSLLLSPLSSLLLPSLLLSLLPSLLRKIISSP